MSTIRRTIITSLATLSLSVIGSTAHANTTTYTADDLFIGFHQTGNNTDYLVNIGQASTFTTAKTLSLGNIAADLSAVFNSTWASNSDVSWGIVGTTHLSTVGSDGPVTIYASRISTGAAWISAFSLSPADSKITSMASAYKGKTSTTNSPYGLIQNNVSTSANNAYASYQPGGVNTGTGNLSFAYFNPTIEGNSASGITTTTLNLYRLPQGSEDPGTLVGSFTINASGTVSFTPAAAASAFNTWASAHSLNGTSALPTADPDHDGLSNMVEFVLGSDPTSGQPTNLPTAVESTSNLTFSFPHNADSVAEYNVAVETSTDLVTWTTQSAGTENGGIYTKVIPKNGATKLFARLHVTKK